MDARPSSPLHDDPDRRYGGFSETAADAAAWAEIDRELAGHYLGRPPALSGREWLRLAYEARDRLLARVPPATAALIRRGRCRQLVAREMLAILAADDTRAQAEGYDVPRAGIYTPPPDGWPA